ncbi:hypothetical protein PPYR_04544 [Photinus pyralis]|uniref:DDE Tnp4 domain-containing protein n=1 Tax=Photinus pyralis TaxID=7054 RepID=A0A5N4AYN0_PHOPY|nr:hypothetical protein PPYR_04544 [Photinus pyralis]
MDDNILLVGAATCNIIIMHCANEPKDAPRKKRKLWMRKWINRRSVGKGLLSMLNEELLLEDPTSYKNFLRMDNASFEKLFRKIEIQITKQNTIMRDSISARSKLETTLRFLATGDTYRSLMYSTRIHESTISRFVPQVCYIIYNFLKDEYLKTPNDTDSWLEIANGFYQNWQFPNCLGALDGRHISFRAPISAGSYYYNYKGDHSIVLLAMADYSYRITYYNVGINGRISDGGVFRESSLSKAIFQDCLNLPVDGPLPGRRMNVPYVIVADDAFPISTRIMKPYPQRNLTYEQKIFNYRLSRCRRIIESTFGILANRFRVLLTPINLKPKKVELITLACIALHNFLSKENHTSYTEIQEDGYCQMQDIGRQGGNRSSALALRIRDEFKDFFNSEDGAVDFQHNAITRYNM